MTPAADDLARPPTESEVAQALARFARDVRRHYGERLRGVYLFGSRARGDHRPDSDVDVAVVLADDGWDFWTEKMLLADLSYDPLIDLGVWLQGWPVSAEAWRNPEHHNNPWLIRAMQRDGKVIADVAG